MNRLRAVVIVSLAAALVLTVTAAPAQADIILRVHPHLGPPGTLVHIEGTGLPVVLRPCGLAPAYSLSFKDASGTETAYGSLFVQDGAFQVDKNIPSGAALGRGKVILTVHYRGRVLCTAAIVAKKRFTVTTS